VIKVTVRMQIFIYVFVVFLSCKTTKPLELFNDKGIEIEPGKCYVSTLTMKSQAIDSCEDGFLLEIKDPYFKEYKSKITQEEIAFYDPKIEQYQIRTRNAYSQFKFRNDIFSEKASSEDQIGFLICNVESPSVYKVITKEELVNVNTIVTRYKLVNDSKIFKTKLSKRPTSLTINQYFMSSGDWSSIKEYVGPSSCGPSLIPIVKMV